MFTNYLLWLIKMVIITALRVSIIWKCGEILEENGIIISWKVCMEFDILFI